MLTLSYTGKYWIKWGSTNEGYNNAVTHYDKNNIYISGEYSTTKNAPIRKTSIGGECQWIRELGDNTNQTRSFSLDTDSFGNVYVSAITYLTVNYNFIVAKYNSSGTLQWKKKLNVNGSNGASLLKVGASNNIYICGWTDQSGAGGEDLLVMKLDSSGNILWQKTLGSVGTENGYSLALDSSENVIITAYNLDDILIVKYNSSGTLQWQRKLGKVKVGTYDAEYAPDVEVDSSDNIYIVGYSITESLSIFGGTTYLFDGVIAKYNSSGVIQWQKKVTSASGSYVQFYGITIDSNDNLYITGGCTVDIGVYRYPVYVAKLNSSGVVQWQRGLYRASSSEVTYALVSYGYDISIDEYGDLCIVGSTTYSSTGNYDKYYPLAFKVPSDGTLVGDYGVFRYGSVSLSYSNGTYTDSTTSFTENTSSFTFTDSTLTDSTSSCSYDNILKITDSSESLTISVKENIITNDLVLHLDSWNSSSYSGSGSTWTDLSGNGNNAELRYSYSYSDKSITFADSGYANITDTSDFDFSGDFSLESWFYLTGTPNATYPSPIFASWESGFTSNDKIILFINSSLQIALQVNTGTNTLIYPSTISLNQWYHIVVSRVNGIINIYLNGQKGTSLNYSTEITPILDMRIGAYQIITDPDPMSHTFEGKIPVARIYKDKGLTEKEVQQNYINQKGRFFGINTINLNT